MSKKKKTPQAPHPTKREFAFSRVAGVSPTEYEAISSSAVAAVALAAIGALGLIWVWGLVASGVSACLALLSLYYIGTSAGTLTGRKIALAALLADVLIGGLGGGRELLDYRRRQADAVVVRGLAQHACEAVRTGDFAGFYRQLGGNYTASVPIGYWHYEWMRFFGTNGPAHRIELSPRTLFLDRLVLVTMNVYVADFDRRLPGGKPGERAVPIRLVYGRPVDLPPPGPGEPPLPPVPESEARKFRLLNVQGFVPPLPEPYREPLVWPARGDVQPIVLGKLGEQPYGLALPPRAPRAEWFGPAASQPAGPGKADIPVRLVHRNVDGKPEVTEVCDVFGRPLPADPPPLYLKDDRPIIGLELRPPLVPPPYVRPGTEGDFVLPEKPWLPVPRPAAEPAHGHSH
jgi:hypothetical protein